MSGTHLLGGLELNLQLLNVPLGLTQFGPGPGELCMEGIEIALLLLQFYLAVKEHSCIASDGPLRRFTQNHVYLWWCKCGSEGEP